MANIVITTLTPDVIEVDFGDYWKDSDQPKSSASVDYKRITVHTKEIHMFGEETGYVKAIMEGFAEWKVSNTEDLLNGVLQIDSIDGNAPASVADLFNRLKVLL